MPLNLRLEQPEDPGPGRLTEHLLCGHRQVHGVSLPSGSGAPGAQLPIEALHVDHDLEQVEHGPGHGQADPVMRLWLARVVEGEPRPLEDHDELRWLGPAPPSPDRWARPA